MCLVQAEDPDATEVPQREMVGFFERGAVTPRCQKLVNATTGQGAAIPKWDQHSGRARRPGDLGPSVRASEAKK